MTTLQFLPSGFDPQALNLGQALESKVVLGGGARAVNTQAFGGTATGLVNRAMYLQPAAQQQNTAARMAVGTQFINAYNADGQPVTIAVNPGGTTQVLTGVNAGQPTVLNIGNANGISIQAQPAAQTLQVRPMQGTHTIINTPQGQRLVQLTNNNLQATAQQGITYKLVQQAVPTATGQRLVVQQVPANATGTVVQRMVPQAQLNIKPTLQHVAIRQAPGNAATQQQMAGLQLGQSVVQVAGRPNAITAHNPTNGLRAVNGTQLTGLATGQQATAMQLPSTMLVRPANGTGNDAAIGQQLQAANILQNTNNQGAQHGVQFSLQPAQSVQQQVKDTVAQQRQQQLLTSLRARVASLNQVQANPAPQPMANGNAAQLNSMINKQGVALANGQQVVNNLSMGSDAPSAASQASLLQNLLASQNQQLLSLQQQGQLNEQLNMLNLTPAQQQALLGASMADLGIQQQLGDNNQQQRLAMFQGMNNLPRASLGDGMNSMPQQLMTTGNGSEKGSHVPNSTTPTPEAMAGKDNLKSILVSIGLELARHNIPVSTAVDAGWLGVLSPADVAVLQAAYSQEERRLAENNTNAGLCNANATAGMNNGTTPTTANSNNNGNLFAGLGSLHTSEPNTAASSTYLGGGLMMWPSHSLPSIAESNGESNGAPSIASRGSPAASVASGVLSHRDGNIGAADLLNMASDAALKAAVDNNNNLSEIDDARFSAFAYDFFGGMDGADVLDASAGLGGELLEPLEPANGTGHMSKRASSVEAAPLRTPSWPADGGALDHLKTNTQSVASFSELGHSTSGERHSSAAAKDMCDTASTASSSNQELVARIANLDLGCGFY